MKLKCVESNVDWFTAGDVYVSGENSWKKAIVNDDYGDEWYLHQTGSKNYEITGLNDAWFEEVD